MQANFYGDSITKVDRKGQTQPFAASGLSGPVGMAINRQTGDVFVANCRSNSIAEIAPDGTVSSFAQSQLFNCPNGISFDRGGNLYVVNFRDNKILKVDQKGVVTPFATISQKGLGHLCFNEDRFYVTAYDSHEIYEVRLDGTAKRILGNGQRGWWTEQARKCDCLFPMESRAIPGRDVFTSTSTSMTRRLHCRVELSFVKLCLARISSGLHARVRNADTNLFWRVVQCGLVFGLIVIFDQAESPTD